MFSLWILAVILIGVHLFRRLRSPLAKIPGPPISAITSIRLVLAELVGHRRLYVHQLHLRYGPVVRLSPHEVSFSSPRAVKEIYMSEGSGYDRTEYYDIFRQFGVRSMFTTLGKAEVS
jgi:hypothetical protein